MQRGTVIAGRFELDELIASGGMGSIYRARDLRTGAPIAIKLILIFEPVDSELTRRLIREAQVLAELHHSGIVRYVSHGLTAGNEAFLAMEWLEGEDLEARLSRGPLAVPAAVGLAVEVATALGVAHRAGVVHRDVKPRNLFLVRAPELAAETGDVPTAALGSRPHVKVVDFGLVHDARARLHSSMVVGTPAYMSPEQARGDAAIGPSTDVFALGCVIHACLTGRPPFGGAQIEAVLAKVLFEDAPPLRELRADVPPELEALVGRMLAKDPARRPADGAAVADLLAAVQRTLVGPAAPAPAPAADGAVGNAERQFFSVLMAAPAAAIPAATLDQLRAVAASHGAVLEALADGSVIMVFSLARHPADLTARAARCALAIQALLPGAALALASGHGEVQDSVPIGAVIDVATGLLRQQPAAIRIDETTRGLLEARFDLGDGLVLLGEIEVGRGSRLLLGRQTPFVGRDRELASLEALLDECIAENAPRVVLVTAPPGAGKSRLSVELLGRLERRGKAPEVWIGHGDPMRAGSPYAIVADAIRRPLGIVRGEPLEDTRGKIRARVASSVAAADAGRVAEFLGELAGISFPDEGSVQLAAARQDPLLMADQVRRAWEDWLAGELAAGPRLIVLEDLHWGDWPSIKLIDAALRRLDDRPLMVLALARPEVHDLFTGLWAERNLEEMRLRELGRAACERFVRQVLGEAATPQRVAGIVQRAHGNAFFLEELLRAAAEGSDEAPETVLAMVETRLARLPAVSRALLRAASVFGEVFWDGGVAALLGMEPRSVVTGLLEELVEREWITPRRETRLAGHKEMVFAHNLVREAAYATLPEKDRVQGHRRAAAWLEAEGENDPVTLAEHHERGGQAELAVSWWLRAGVQALDGNDFAAAIARADQAARLGASGEALGALRLLQAEAHGWRAEHAQAAPRAREALALLPPGGDLWASAMHHAAWALRVLGEHEALAGIGEELRAVFTRVRSGALMISMCATSIKLVEAGLYAPAARLLDALEAAAAAAPELVAGPLVSAWIANARAYRASVAGNPHALLGFLRGSIDHWEAAGDQRNACFARTNSGYACIQLGAYDEAERELRAAIVTAERLAIHPVVDANRQNMGWALALAGRVGEALELERAAAEAFRARGDARLEGVSRLYLALIQVLAGDLGAAAHACEEALGLLGPIPSWRAYALAARAHIALVAGDVAAARAAAVDALAIVESLGGIEEGEAFVRLVHAEALWSAGALDEARAAIAAARARLLARASAIDDPRWRASFLDDVPENARTLARAREWLVSR